VAQRCYVIEVGRIVLEGNIKDMMENDSVRRAFLG
jgi:ABC-type lipopolysaccharide export system ATPase subunit